jgi:hypothetical protein
MLFELFQTLSPVILIILPFTGFGAIFRFFEKKEASSTAKGDFPQIASIHSG